MALTGDDSGGARERTSYEEILASSALVGASTAAGLVISIVRTKILAVMLGPAFFGLMGALQLVLDLSRSVAQLGINSSGVKQIAEAMGSGDLERTARTAAVLRSTAMASSLLGAAALALVAPHVSMFTFANLEHSEEIAWLSLALLFALIAGGQAAALQGMRRVRDLAVMGLLSSLFGAVATVALVFQWGRDGIVPALIASGFLAACVGWWYRRKVALPAVRVAARDAWLEVGALLRLGMAFMASALLMLGAAYLVRIFVLRHSGLEAAGHYQAAWAIGGLYIGVILQAMGTDFYPRLVPAVARPAECNRLVNEQTRVALLLAGPGTIATLTFAPLLVPLLYSSRFEGAIEILRWITLGMALRVIIWPIGFIVVAAERPRLFVGTELAWASVNVALSWLLVSAHGAVGAGIAFALSYGLHGLVLYPIVRRLTGFAWTGANLRVGSAYGVLVVAVFLAGGHLSPWAGALVGVAATLVSSAYSVHAISRLVPLRTIPARLRWLFRMGQTAAGSRSR